MISAFALSLLLAADSPVQIDATATTPPKAERLICRRIGELGSRLRATRVCKTKADWDAQKLEDRMNIERSQSQACVRGSGC